LQESKDTETSNEVKTNSIRQLYDKILKRILTLSAWAVVNLINGLFGMNFPPGSKVTYNWTENVDDELEKTISDAILTIHAWGKCYSYHIEAEINTADTNNSTIVLRIFEYGLRDALRHRVTEDGKTKLKFPQPIIILLEHNSNSPDEVTLTLDFGASGEIDFVVPTMKFLDYSIEELDKKRMVILLPLYLLKFRKQVDKSKKLRNKGDAEALRRDARAIKDMIDNGILKAIDENIEAGVIDNYDAYVLTEMLSKMYENLYGGLDVFKEEGVDSKMDDRLVLRIDVEVSKARKEAALEAALAATLANSRLIARNLLAKGIVPELVAEATNLPIEEIKSLQLELPDQPLPVAS